MAESTRFSSAIQVGTSVLVALAAGVVLYNEGDVRTTGTDNAFTQSGSTVAAGGGRLQLANLGNAACERSPSGRYFNCYQETTLTDTGGCVAAGCGSRSYNPASITKPYTGSGLINSVSLTCGPSTVSTNVSAGQVSASTASGFGVWTRKFLGSGAIAAYQTGSQVWAKATPIIKLSTPARVGTSTCIFAVKSEQVAAAAQ